MWPFLASTTVLRGTFSSHPRLVRVTHQQVKPESSDYASTPHSKDESITGFRT